MLKKIIEEDTKLICQLLVEKNLTIKELQQLTDYQEAYICFVVGWLLKENKIICSDNNNELFFTLSF
ncbi:MAG: winged helix-turn-helix domain-containing protein [Prevotella sp.]|nr:winged helix-turn-helix domain-containing protein [Prevotella sp.]MDR3059242.1 winged helix-turn-helix domain-containing protein [Prevotella sp.]